MNFRTHYNALGSPLPTPEEMRAWDTASIRDFNIPAAMLMENAAREALDVVSPMLAPQRRILIIMGGGNNGGDGACLARHLLDAGHHILVCHTKPLDALPEAAREHAAIAAKVGVPFTPLFFERESLVTAPEFRATARMPHMVIDALLGTGFSGDLRESEREIIRFINSFRDIASIVSLDIPSGLDGLTGIPRPEAVRAHHTVAFEAAKVGLALPSAAEFIGALHVRRIGIPHAVRTRFPPSFRLTAPHPDAWPQTAPTMHKGEAGRVLVVGGSKGLAGAPALTALAALRAGAGLATVACPEQLEPHVRHAIPEIMTAPLGQGDAWEKSFVPECIAAIRALPHAAALVVGPGMGRSAAARAVVTAIAREKARPPMVLDADGLVAPGTGRGAGRTAILALLREDDCITPHPGEASHLLNTTATAVQAARIEALRSLTRITKATVVLKGAGTLIARGDSPVFVAPFCNPTLAVGGSGDVLAGVVAAILARTHTKDSLYAACLGVYLHGKAGEILSEVYPKRGALAREIADAIPRARITAY